MRPHIWIDRTAPDMKPWRECSVCWQTSDMVGETSDCPGPVQMYVVPSAPTPEENAADIDYILKRSNVLDFFNI